MEVLQRSHCTNSLSICFSSTSSSRLGCHWPCEDAADDFPRPSEPIPSAWRALFPADAPADVLAAFVRGSSPPAEEGEAGTIFISLAASESSSANVVLMWGAACRRVTQANICGQAWGQGGGRVVTTSVEAWIERQGLLDLEGCTRMGSGVCVCADDSLHEVEGKVWCTRHAIASRGLHGARLRQHGAYRHGLNQAGLFEADLYQPCCGRHQLLSTDSQQNVVLQVSYFALRSKPFQQSPTHETWRTS